MPAPPPEAPPRRLKVLGILAFLSWLHLYLGGLLTAGVVAGFGPMVATWWRFLEDTEATAPSRPFPWIWAGLAAFLPLPWALRARWGPAGLATIPLIALSVRELVWLLTAAGP